MGDDLYAAGRPPTPQPPAVLYHYTRHEAALRGILSGEMRATEYVSLNDSTEVSHGLEIFRDLARERFESEPEDTLAWESLKRFLMLYAKLKPTVRGTFLVASFSEAKDDLSQWRSYAGNATGFMIGVRVQETPALVAPAPRGQLGLGLFQMVYRQARKVRLARGAIDRILLGAGELAGSAPDDDLCGSAALALFRCAALAAQSMKHDTFSSEREWRLTVMGPPDGAGALKTMLRDGGESVRYFPIPLAKEQIDEVMVGPVARESAEAEVRALLPDGLSGLRVTRSRSPYRG